MTVRVNVRQLVERRSRWATSLRLHRYARTHGSVLRRYESYSVLGVAEHVYTAEGPGDASRWVRGEHGFYHVVGDDGRPNSIALTPECAAWFGLVNVDPHVPYPQRPGSGGIKLTTLDGSGRTFPELATLLTTLPTTWNGEV